MYASEKNTTNWIHEGSNLEFDTIKCIKAKLWDKLTDDNSPG